MRKLFSLTVLFTMSALATAQTPTTPAKKPIVRHKTTTASKKPAAATKPVASGPAKFTTDEPKAIFDTTAGTLTCTLFPKQAPKTVDNFVGLATGTKAWIDPFTHKPKQGVPLYDGTIFHRVIPNFMIQGGDPLGTGSGDPGYSFEDEFSPELEFDRPGRLAMANAGPNTNGSQFFITEVPTPHLNNKHTIFGQCDDESVDLVRKIARMPRGENDRPDQNVKINHITIEGLAKPVAAAKKAAPGTKKPASTKPGAKAGAKTSTTTPKKPQ